MKLKNIFAFIPWVCLVTACNNEPLIFLAQNTPGQVTLIGEAVQGENIVASILDEDGIDAQTLHISWFADESLIVDENLHSLELTIDEVGRHITTRISYTDNLGESESLEAALPLLVSVAPTIMAPSAEPQPLAPVSENPTDITVGQEVEPPAPVTETTTQNKPGQLLLSGEAVQGNSIVATIADEDGIDDAMLQISWFADGSAIVDEDTHSLVLTSDEIGKSITIQVSYTDKRGKSESLEAELLTVVEGRTSGHVAKLANTLEAGGPSLSPDASATDTVSFSSEYSVSGSDWEVDWSEDVVFDNLYSFSNGIDSNQNYQIRFGKGGQIYSFTSPGFGEALPPQWRRSYDETGATLPDQEETVPISSHHGNWAPWNDEVWQLVGSDQKDSIDGRVKTQNIHMAGPYMNNFGSRQSDHTSEPRYSDKVLEYFDPSDDSVTKIVWGQSENPNYVYNSPEGCDVCFSDEFRPSVLFTQKFKSIGQGTLQVDFHVYNFHRTRDIDFWNLPFIGIRHSSLPYLFVSDDVDDITSYRQVNTKVGHPETDDPLTPEDESAGYIPEFRDAETIRTTGSTAVSSGWAAFSTSVSGDGPSLAFVTSKETANPSNGIADFRFGTAMGEPIRDATILTRRAFGGARDATTGLKPWALVSGQSLRGRYFIVVDENITNVVSQIEDRELVAYASTEIIDISNEPSNDISYQLLRDRQGRYSAYEAGVREPDYTFNSQPFTGSYPVFLMASDSVSALSSDPFYLTTSPYTGAIKSMELLGYSSDPQTVVLP